MGACLEPIPQMGPFRTEIRGESFYLTAPRSILRVASPTHWSVTAAAADQAVAALDQAMHQTAFVEYIVGGGTFTSRPVAEPRDGWLEFTWTDCHAHPDNPHVNGHDRALVELPYQDTPAVRWILNALSGTPTPPHWVDDPAVPLSEHKLTGYPLLAACSCRRWHSVARDSVKAAQGWIWHMRREQEQAHALTGGGR
ncbi:hypothetical protein GCM10010466_39340 [Planomonospora alba]|uniref:Uncharacterized protein n=1 Tax=Planomonospora alba TaxID=161354 RepID=A0ABP6ND61_9ACTN